MSWSWFIFLLVVIKVMKGGREAEWLTLTSEKKGKSTKLLKGWWSRRSEQY